MLTTKLVARWMHVEARLAELKLTLPAASPAKGNYVASVRTGQLVFLSGHLPYDASGQLITGKVGKELTVQQGYDVAKTITLSLLSTLKSEVGDLDRIQRIVKVTGMVQCDGTFSQHPQVINGCSDTLVAAFGDKIGRHARVAAGFVSLPLNVPVEIDLVAEVKP